MRVGSGGWVPKRTGGELRFDIIMSVNYGSHVVTVIRSSVFDRWLRALRDPQARARINARILRLAFEVILLLLCGGDKSTQRKDIERARSLAREFEG